MDAYANSKTPPSERDRRATPPAVFERICRMTGLVPVRDVCADEDNYKVRPFWTVEDNALEISWRHNLGVNFAGHHPCVWMNPPYSDPAPWCKKAAFEADKGLLVLGLLPDDRSTGWYQEWVDQASVVFVPDRRIAFLGPDGKPQPGNPKGSVFPLWTPWGNGGLPQEIRFGLDVR